MANKNKNKKKNNEYQKNLMKKRTQDSSKKVRAKQCEYAATKRAEKYGCYINTDTADVLKRIDIYHKCHQMNARDGKHTWAVDHMLELALGGPHTSSNLNIIPFSENISKSCKLNPRKKSTRPISQPDDLTTR